MTQRDFENKVINKLNTIDENTKPKYRYNDVTLFEFAEDWLSIYKKPNIKQTTYHKYECMLKHIPNYLYNTPMSQIRQMDVNRFLISFAGLPRQKQQYFTLLKDIFSKAVANQYIDYNPMATLPMPKYTKKTKQAFTRADEQKFVEACLKEKHGVMFLIMLYEGLRKGEASALYYSDIVIIDVDKKIGYINIDKGINDDNKMDTPKTKNSIRQVPIFDDLFPYVLRYADNNEHKRIFNIADVNVYKHFNKIIERSGLPKGKYTTHSLRHTFATRCCENGVVVNTCSKWCGHSSVSITSNIYQHINDDFEQEQIALMNKKRKKGGVRE